MVYYHIEKISFTEETTLKTHRTYRFLTALVSFMLLLTLGCLPILAAEDFLPQNQAAADETAAKFSALITLYDGKEASSTTPADRTIEMIGTYSSEAAALIPSNMAAARTEDLRPTFSLLYQKGELAAKITWIAYVHGVMDGQSDASALREQYATFCNDVRAMSDETTLTTHADALCIAMNRAVFKAKINRLPRDLGIAEAHIWEELRDAKDAIDTIASPDVDGSAYLDVYHRTRAVIVLEQNRLLAKEEFSNVYDLLGLPSADKLLALSALAADLDAASSTAAINRALLTAVEHALQTALPGNGLYTAAYRQALVSAMTDAITAAPEEAVANLCPYLNGNDAAFAGKPFTARAQIVFAKDRVEALRLPSDDTALCNLLNTYVQAGGILERCETAEALQFEVMRATERADWARKKLSYLHHLEQILPTASVGTLLTEAKTVYAEIDAAICALPVTSANGETTIRSLLDEGLQRLNDLVCEAEAERFRITHADVLKKSTVTMQDHALLKTAIAAFDALPPATRQKLSAEQRTLNTHYQSLAAQTIRAYLRNDSCAELREHAIEHLISLMDTMDTATVLPSALAKEADALCVRAEALSALLDRYAEARTTPHFSQYDSDSVARLQALVEQSVALLSDKEQTDASADHENATLPTVSTVLAQALTTLEQYTAIAELRWAANGSPSQKVAEALLSAEQDILQETDLKAIVTLREAALFQIGAYRKADEMRRELEALRAEILSLRALTDEEKTRILASSAMQALSQACIHAENAGDAAALRAIATSFARDKHTLLEASRAESLAAGLREAIEEIASATQALTARFNAYLYLSDAARISYLERLRLLTDEWNGDVQDPAITWESLDARLLSMKESMAGLAANAETEEEEACRQGILREWQTRYGNAAHYSDAYYTTVTALLEEGKTLLQKAKGISALLALRDSVDARLALVPNRLDEAKKTAKDMLKKAYEEVLKNKICYHENAWSQLEDIYYNSLEKVDLYSEISDEKSVLNIATETIQAMRNIRMDRLYTHEQGVAENGSLSSSYPPDHCVDTSGYWASLSAANAIPFGTHFSAMPFAADKNEALQHAIRRGAVVDAIGNRLTRKQLSALKHATLLHGLSLSYSASESSSAPSYRISILLPAEYDVQTILGIIFIREDGCVEFYPCSAEESIISFDISHFSDFYIVSEKAINLKSFIIILSLLLFCEIAAILFILTKRRARDMRQAMPALLPLSPFALVRRITPQGGLPAVIILGLCILAATSVLVWLLLVEHERRKDAPNRQALLVSKSETEHAISAPQKEELLPIAKAVPSLPCHPLSEITAELANEMMSDEEAAKATENGTPREGTGSIHVSGKKTAINIDVISSHFEAHDTVSLATLKKRGLVPKNAKAIKILARGTLDKPLTVLANDFSATAIKMILLTGGEAILVERDCVE